MKKLHSKQKAILDLLKENVDSPLSMAEIGRQADISSPGVLYHHLAQLENKGYLKRNPNDPRDYVVLDTPEDSVVFVNKYGLAQCGPNGSILDDTPIGQVPIPTGLLRFPASEAFIVEAKGNSMEPKIVSGDIVIARKQGYADPGDLIVCVHNEVAIIKQFLQVEGRIILNSLNKEVPLIEANSSFRIEGIVKNILRYH